MHAHLAEAEELRAEVGLLASGQESVLLAGERLVRHVVLLLAHLLVHEHHVELAHLWGEGGGGATRA